MSLDTRRWHHVVLTTYGAWLHGDPRGFRTRHHRQHVEGDYKSPPEEDYARLEAHARKSHAQPPVELSSAERELVGKLLRDRLLQGQAWVLCSAVASQHVHLLVKMPVSEGRRLIGLAKKHATFELRSTGRNGKLWGVRSKSILIRSREHQRRTYHYILRHAEHAAWTGVWKEDQTT